MITKRPFPLWPILTALTLVSSQALSDPSLVRDLAEKRVKEQVCHGADNVEVYLSHQARHSQGDLGWHVFTTDDGGFDVERVYMISKAMALRYRWHVDSQSRVSPANRRAEALCF